MSSYVNANIRQLRWKNSPKLHRRQNWSIQRHGCDDHIVSRCCLGLWLPGRSDRAFISFAVLFGITSGAGIGLGPVLIVSVSPRKELGFRMGTILAIAAIGTLTSPRIAGPIVAADGSSYRWACVFSGISFVLAATGILILQGRLCAWKLPAKL